MFLPQFFQSDSRAKPFAALKLFHPLSDGFYIFGSCATFDLGAKQCFNGFGCKQS